MNNYWKFFQTKWLFVVIVTLAIIILSLAGSFFRPAQYRTTVAFDVITASQPQTEAYQYGGYYSLQAAELFGQTVLSWFLNPAFEQEIFTQARVAKKQNFISSFGNYFKGKQLSPQQILVSFTGSSTSEADKVAASVVALTETKARAANQAVAGQTWLTLTASAPVVVNQKLSFFVVALLGLIVGLLVSMAIVTLGYFYKQE